MMPTTSRAELIGRTFPMHRPSTLVASATIGARRYRRGRDLPGAVPGLLAGAAEAILPRLVVEERRCEEARRSGHASYRPARHVQILSALLAEAADCGAQASGVPAAPGRGPAGPPRPIRRDRPARPGDGPIDCPPASRAQAKASGSEALRSST